MQGESHVRVLEGVVKGGTCKGCVFLLELNVSARHRAGQPNSRGTFSARRRRWPRSTLHGIRSRAARLDPADPVGEREHGRYYGLLAILLATRSY